MKPMRRKPVPGGEVPESRAVSAEQAGLPRAELNEASHSLTRFTNWVIGIYLVVVLLVSLALRTTPSADVFFVLVAIGAVMAGRGIAFVRDWGPFLLVFLAWEAMRGVANLFGQSVQSDSVITIERALMLGTIPAVELQEALRTPGQINALDVIMSFVYISHFFFPLALAFALWWTDRARYYRFVVTLMVVSFAAFFTFIAVPVAPPRFAGKFGEALPVVDVVLDVTRAIEWNGFSWMYGNLVGNPVAAFPSMHAAYPVLVFLFLRETSKRAALIWLPAIAAIWFATVYLGHHYVVDLFGGAIYAVAGYFVIRSRAASWLARRYTSSFRRLYNGARSIRRPNNVAG
jgi:membrane-associated phospholipid phosphatase